MYSAWRPGMPFRAARQSWSQFDPGNWMMANFNFPLPSTLLHIVVFDHRIRKQISAKSVEPRFQVGRFFVDIDLKIFPDPHTSHLGHTQMLHRIAHRRALGIKHRRLRGHHDIHFHAGISGLRDGSTSAMFNGHGDCRYAWRLTSLAALSSRKPRKTG